MFTPRSIQHCRACGARGALRNPADDNRERAVCTACATVHYENPLNVVGTLPFWDDRVLLCRRNIEPRRGLWTLPAGFMELGESAAEAPCARPSKRPARTSRCSACSRCSTSCGSARSTCSTGRGCSTTRFRPRPRNDRGAAVRRSRHSMAGARVQDDTAHAGAVLRRPPRRRRVRLSRRGHRLTPRRQARRLRCDATSRSNNRLICATMRAVLPHSAPDPAHDPDPETDPTPLSAVVPARHR